MRDGRLVLQELKHGHGYRNWRFKEEGGPKQKRASGRRKFSFHTLHPIGVALDRNPRREGTPGFQSLEIIRSKPGIAFEDYLVELQHAESRMLVTSAGI